MPSNQKVPILRRWLGMRKPFTAIGATVQMRRGALGWSQAQLAERSGVSERTIQRLETTSRCARRTAQRVVACLNRCEAAGQPVEPPVLASTYLAPVRALLLGLLLAAPGIVFVVVNLIRNPFGFSGFPDPFDGLLQVGVFNTWSPLVFIGGPILGLVLNIAAQCRVHGSKRAGILELHGLYIQIRGANLAVVVVSLATLGVLGSYVFVENLGHWIEAIASG